MLAFCDRCTCSVSLSPPQAALDSAAPSRGAFQNGRCLGSLPCKGRCRRRRRRGAAPCPANILPGRRGAADRRTPLRSTDQGSAGFCRTLPAQSGNAPLSRLRRQLPLQGSLWGGCRPIKPPLQGEVDAPQAQTEGCGALPRKYLSGSPGAAGRRPPPKIQQKPAPGRRVPCRGRGCVCFWVRGVFPARSGAY